MPLLDETAAELLASVIIATGRRLRLALASPRGRKRADIDLARWFDTYALTELTLPRFLGDCPMTRWQRSCRRMPSRRFCMSYSRPASPTHRRRRSSGCRHCSGRLGRGYCPEADSATLFGFFDDQICELVGRLSSADPELLHRIRQEAYLARVVAAIDRHVVVSAGRLDSAGDRDFVMRYRDRLRTGTDGCRTRRTSSVGA